MNDFNTVNLSDVATARVDEYFGLWAIHATRGMAMFERVRKMDLKTHIETTDKPRPSASIKNIGSVTLANSARMDLIPTDGGDSTDTSAHDSVDETAPIPAGSIAVLYASGTLMKQESSLDASTSTIVLRRQLRLVQDDPRYSGAILCIDSPGGTVSGTSDLASDVAALAAVKPVICHVQDLCASAAYWAASQCTEVYANNGTAVIGSIGTLLAFYDYSKMCEEEGIKAKVYATGPLKAAGFAGTEVTPEQDAFFQAMVDSTQKYFTAGVSEGRELSVESVTKLATGAVFLAGEATDNGLIDGIKTFDQCLSRMSELLALRQVTTSPGMTVGAAQENRMKSESGKPAANAGTVGAAPENNTAIVPDIKADLKRFTDAFGMASGAQWLMEGKTFDEASALHNKAGAEAFEALKKQNAELLAENAQLKTRVKDLRGEQTPVNADLPPDPEAKHAAKPGSLDNRIGKNLARVARSIVLPTSNN